jgi:DNA polymerase-3 subunit alpha
MKAQFISGATAKGHPKDKLEKIWVDWESFAQYAFNKSHSTCYALVAYQTAYLKANYPQEYMAAVLNHAGNIEKITFFMEECKRMGIKVLGPDVNESNKGFAVNKKGEIRFGFAGMKGVGEAALDCILEERNKRGTFTSIYDLIKRVNQRSVNKKSLESMAYAGAFDCFKDIHRAQYFDVPQGETSNGLEKILRFGTQYHGQLTASSNTLFGDLQQADIIAPKLPDCPQWPLIKLLDFEKEVTGMFMSGHPLDNFSFEMKYYGLTPISEFNEFKEAVSLLPNPGKLFRMAGLVSSAQHKISKNGNKYGVFFMEDYSGKMELTLWSDDYVKYSNYMEAGMLVYISGSFRQRFAASAFEFKISTLSLLETLKKSCTKKLKVNLHPKYLNNDIVEFLSDNVKTHPGKCLLEFCLADDQTNIKIALENNENTFEMNDEMTQFLQKLPEFEVAIELT